MKQKHLDEHKIYLFEDEQDNINDSVDEEQHINQVPIEMIYEEM